MLNDELLADKIYPQRTTLQNRSLHLYFTLLARALNDAGLDMREVLKPEVYMPWNKATVKDFLWKPVLRAMFQKDHTAKMTSKETTEVFETLNRHLGERFGIHSEWPSLDVIMLKLKDLDDEQKIPAGIPKRGGADSQRRIPHKGGSGKGNRPKAE